MTRAGSLGGPCTTDPGPESASLVLVPCACMSGRSTVAAAVDFALQMLYPQSGYLGKYGDMCTDVRVYYSLRSCRVLEKVLEST